MKKLLPILLITLTLANADITPGPQKTIIDEQTLSKALQTESSAISELTLAQNEISKVTD